MIYLLGDSYVENFPIEDIYVENHKRWYDLLQESTEHQVINFGKRGIGSIDIMKQFSLLTFNDEDYVVIVLSSPYRINWEWTDQLPAMLYNDWLDGKVFSDNQHFCLSEFYRVMHDELKVMNLKNILYLQTFAVKIIVFTVFDKIDYQIKNDHFYVYPKPLFEITNEENNSTSVPLLKSWPENATDEVCRSKINHLTEENHQIFFNIISNYFFGTNYSTQFLTNCCNSLKLNKFIYE